MAPLVGNDTVMDKAREPTIISKSDRRKNVNESEYGLNVAGRVSS